ncbi:MAG: glycosyltransferase family 39 protein [Chloroflexi bacterium]|nr:glycosyltransferase family 39 protein [Chloroflexota bacterium]
MSNSETQKKLTALRTYLFAGFTALGAAFLYLWNLRREKSAQSPRDPIQEQNNTASQTPQSEPEISLAVENLPQKINLKPGARLELRVDTPARAETAHHEQGSQPHITISVSIEEGSNKRSGIFGWISNRVKNWPYSLAQTLFVGALVIYLATRLIGLTDYPIFFFTDEAIQTNLAADFMRDSFRNHDSELWPTYFKNVDKYSLSLSVYAQIIPYQLFGRSVFVTRAVSVLIGTLGAVWVGLILRDIFKIRYWWSGVLLLSITPGWFLHSRTAFETAMMAAFYAGFLYYYLMYRNKNPRMLYLALIWGAAAFYTYNPGRVVMVVSGLFLLFSDLRYHLANRKTALKGLGLLVLLALPFVRFMNNHPTAAEDQMRSLASYWLHPIPLTEKLTTFWSEYIYGLDPRYWFFSNARDLPRHIMGGYSQIMTPTLLFAVIGLGLILWGFRKSAYRTLLFALLAAPSGAALVETGITRALVFVIPATILIALGLNYSLDWLSRVRKFRPNTLTISLFAILALVNINLTRDALINGPTWHTNYSLGGMQYGAQQAFAAIDEFLEENPTDTLLFSPTWTNGAHVVATFFFPEYLPFQIGSINGHLFHLLPLDDATVFVSTPEEYELVTTSGKFTDINIERIVPYPDGNPGFYFLRLRYVDNIAEILAAEQEERRILLEKLLVIDKELVQVRYSMLDMGAIESLFDGDQFTVGRTFEANPFVLELNFPSPRDISGLRIVLGSATMEINVFIFPTPEGEPVNFTGIYGGSVEAPEIEFDFGETVSVQRIRIEFKDLGQGEPGHVHIWEIGFE